MTPARAWPPPGPVIAAHADWSVDPRKRWMTLARPAAEGWCLSLQPVGPVGTLLDRLRDAACGGPVALGLDVPLGVPRAFGALLPGTAGFPALLRRLRPDDAFLQVADTLVEVGPGRPFYPRRPAAGMTRLAHARALGLATAGDLSRACDRATALRPAGAPVFWTLGANQSGKAAIAAWRDLVLPALHGGVAGGGLALWPFDGAFRALLRPGRVAVAEAYPAESLRQLGLVPMGSKRRQADRTVLAERLRHVMPGLRTWPDPAMDRVMAAGFGADPAGEDRMDSTVGLLGLLAVLAGHRTDAAPPDPAIATWEGWVLGQDW